MTTRLLAIDTATEACSAALLIDDQVLLRSEVCPREHTRRLLPMVDELLAEAGIGMRQLDALAFGRGPGSFTGVRIATGLVQGLAFGAGCPVVGISTLAAMAQLAAEDGAEYLLCAIDARMGEVYWGVYRRQADGLVSLEGQERVIAPQRLVEQADLEPHAWQGVGTGWQTYADTLSAMAPAITVNDTVRYPRADAIARLARPRFAAGEAVAAEQALPVYLRDEVAWKKLPGR